MVVCVTLNAALMIYTRCNVLYLLIAVMAHCATIITVDAALNAFRSCFTCDRLDSAIIPLSV